MLNKLEELFGFTFLCDADGSTSHPNTKPISTCVYQILGLSRRYHWKTCRDTTNINLWIDSGLFTEIKITRICSLAHLRYITVSSHNLYLRVLLFDVMYHVNLVHRVALGGILTRETQTDGSGIPTSSCTVPFKKTLWSNARNTTQLSSPQWGKRIEEHFWWSCSNCNITNSWEMWAEFHPVLYTTIPVQQSRRQPVPGHPTCADLHHAY